MITQSYLKKEFEDALGGRGVIHFDTFKRTPQVDVKVKCIEQGKTQAKLAEEIDTIKTYVNRVIKKNEAGMNMIQRRLGNRCWK